MLKEMKIPARIFYAANYHSLMDVISQHPIDLAICDINMPGCDNFRVIEDIRKIRPDIKILIFSAYREDLYAPRYLQAGANGYLQKDCSNEEIREAITATLEKGRYISPTITEVLIKKAFQQQEQKENPLELLSDREMEVAKLLLQGQGLLEIANLLKLHIATVSTYKKRIYEKINVSNLPDLITIFRNYSDPGKTPDDPH